MVFNAGRFISPHAIVGQSNYRSAMVTSIAQAAM